VDYAFERWINSSAGHHPLIDGVMVHIAAWGEYAFIIVVAVWLLQGVITANSLELLGAVTALVAAVVALSANQTIAHIWYRPRPYIAHPNTVHLLLHHNPDASFPSDHAAASMAISFVLMNFHRYLGILLLLFALVMCYSRVYVGDHYPGDIFAGLIVGLASALLLLFCLRQVVKYLGDRLESILTRARAALF